MISRRSIISSLLAAPVIIRTPGLLMPIKAIAVPRAHLVIGQDEHGYRVLEPSDVFDCNKFGAISYKGGLRSGETGHVTIRRLFGGNLTTQTIPIIVS